MKLSRGMTFGERQTAGVTQEPDLPLISTTTPSALAAEVEITLPAGYSFFEVRVTGLPTTGVNAAFAAVADAGGYGGEGGSLLQSPRLLFIDPLVAQTCYQIGSGDFHAGHNGTLTKIRFAANGTGSGDTFVGTGKIWLHGILT